MPLFGPPDVEKLKRKRDARGLIKALEHRSVAVRRDAAEALVQLGDPLATGALIAVLRDQDSDIRQSAALGLGELGGEEAIEALIQALADPAPGVRMIAATALGNLGDARAAQPLTGLLADTLSEVRESAVEALQKLGDVAAQPLVKALANVDSDVRSISAEILVRMGWVPNSDEERARYLNELIPASSDESLRQLRRHLRGDPSTVARISTALRGRAEDRRRAAEAAEASRRAPRQALERFMASGIASADEAARVLALLYDQSPRDDGFLYWEESARPVREIGERLYRQGGFELMLEAHQLFAGARPEKARNLEMVWDGVGTWAG